MQDYQDFQEFKLFSIPLYGINLIEASAGTGKTYTIENLFTRLLLEKELTVEKILVVTFTEAATDELRDRIRKRLNATQIAFSNNFSENKELSELLKKYPNHSKAFKLLTNALRGFDEASIFTIHSFCHQTLQDNAFGSGVLFDTELASDLSHLFLEIVEDFWRQHFYQSSQLFISYAQENGYKNPASLLPILGQGRHIAQPFLKVIPEFEKTTELIDIKEKEADFSQTFKQAQALWRAEKVDIENLLLQAIENKQLKGNKYRKNWLAAWLTELDNFFNTDTISTKFPDKFEKFTRKVLEDSKTKNKIAPNHAFFELCDELLVKKQSLFEAFKNHLLALKIELFNQAKQAFEKKKYWHNVQSFDDLLTKLYYALKGKNSKNLAESIRKKYPAALIDEFQDTDPIQYDIFKAIYHTEAYYHSALFLIGDPKQAIYSFRGADVFTYLSASENAKKRYTLTTNWRSEPKLIQAVNLIFSECKNPFLFDTIPFRPVDSAQEPCLQIENQHLPPMHIWFAAKNGEKSIPKEWANANIPYAVGAEISRLLTLAKNGQARIAEKPLVAGDIAILVRSNRQAQNMQKVLIRLNIPSVLYSRESIWDSNEVLEIERLLLAIADPNDETLLRAALTTDLLGMSGDKLYELKGDNRAWQNWVEKFQNFNGLWQKQSFIQMMTTLLVALKMQVRLLRYPDGERRLTNVLHLIELLQNASIQQKLGIKALCTWLSMQRQKVIKKSEENQKEWQLRLESDEPRVKIVTIHRSKGLEYPIVFCPFVWDGKLHNKISTTTHSKNNEKTFTFHDDKQRLILDLGSAEMENNREKAMYEEYAENLRLFYVAVTRAKHRCYLIWGDFNDAHSSPLAHLLYSDSGISAKVDDSILLNTLDKLREKSEGAIAVSDLPVKTRFYQAQSNTENSQWQARQFKGKIVTDWKVSSFSSLTAQNEELSDRPDYDEISEQNQFITITQAGSGEESSIFNFPRGAQAGTFMHALFEHLDFTNAEISELVENTLKQHGYEVEWQETIEQLIFDVLNTPLKADSPNFTLSEIDKAKRLNELEFFYPLQKVTPYDLQAIFMEYNAFEGKPLTFQTLHGFMKGYIDMVFEYEGKFYIIDYKSNFLGSEKQAYHYNSLSQVITEESYYLQYHIYTIALHRYLSLRLPDYDYQQHFGGVFYFFLRGMNPEWGANYGIYYTLPKFQLIDKLSNYFE